MPLTIADAEDSWLTGEALLTEWKKENLLSWYGPMIVSMTGMMVADLTPERKQELLNSGVDLPPALRSMLEE